MEKGLKKKSSSELDPRQVYDFLKDNPSFIEKHWNLFAEHVPSSEDLGNVFLKKQVETLSQRQSEQDKTIKHILDITKNLEQMQDMLMGFSKFLLDQGHPSLDPVDFVVRVMGEEFNIDNVVIFEESSEAHCACYHELRQRVAHRSSICDDRVSKSLLKQIFGKDAKSIKSCAFVPILQSQAIVGVVVLGSSDAERFHPDLGVLYLNRIGSLIGSYLSGKRLVLESSE